MSHPIDSFGLKALYLSLFLEVPGNFSTAPFTAENHVTHPAKHSKDFTWRPWGGGPLSAKAALLLPGRLCRLLVNG